MVVKQKNQLAQSGVTLYGKKTLSLKKTIYSDRQGLALSLSRNQASLKVQLGKVNAKQRKALQRLLDDSSEKVDQICPT